MASREANGVCEGGKVGPFSNSEGFITYKRRKCRRSGSWISPRGEPHSPSENQMMKMPHQAFLCNGNGEIGGQQRIVSHWKNVFEKLARSTDLKKGCSLQSCIGRPLPCGPPGYSNSINLNGVYKKEDHRKCHYKLQRHGSLTYSVLQHNEVVPNGVRISVNGAEDTNTSISKSQTILFDLLVSHKFALLCNLLCENFQCGKNTDSGDFSAVISKIKDGTYQDSIECAVEDIQLSLEKFLNIGEEMMLLASELSSLSQTSCRKQVRGCSSNASSEQEFEDACPAVGKEMVVDLYDRLQLMANYADSLTKHDQRVASHFEIVSTCKKCGSDAHETDRIICDGCEDVYHVLCITPSIEKIVTRSWYCTTCVKKRASAEQDLSFYQYNHLYHKGTMWCQHDDPRYQECRRKKHGVALAVSTGESPIPTSESNNSSEPSKATSVAPLCKQCGGCEEEDKLFLVCSHSHCPYKYYHIRCLRAAQVASQHQQPNNWYCPSCLCRGCLTDKDDDLICICDSCDEAYHTYCMRPPQDEIPDGMWYCHNCEREGKGTSGPEHWM